MKKHLILLIILPVCLLCGATAFAAGDTHGFVQVDSRWIASENAQGILYRHDPSGLHLFHLDNDSTELAFSIGFITPPASDGGANHVLEHAVLCGSEKYPARNLMHHLRSTSLASVINAVTNDQTTAYMVRTANPADFDNLLDVYLNAMLHPLILTEPNIFLGQGFRWEVSEDGIAPNGVVYNELRQNSLETNTSMLREVLRALNASLFEDSTPVFSSGGEIDALQTLTYAEVLYTYGAYYLPDNALVFISGKQDVGRAFSLLDEYLRNVPGGNGRVTPEYRLRDEALAFGMPGGADDAGLMDVGFAFSGIPVAQARSAYARDAMLMLLVGDLRERFMDVYMALDETSGYATFSIIVSGVPANEAAALIDYVDGYFSEKAGGLIDSDAMRASLDAYEWMMEDEHGWALTSTLKGFANGGDPYALLDKAADFVFLRENPSYVEAVWRQHIVNTPHKAAVAIPQRPAQDAGSPSFTGAQTARLRQQTKAFHAWADAPETARELACIPTLRIEDYLPADLRHPVDTGDQEGIRYWLQPGEPIEAMMAFAVPDAEDRWLDLSLLSRAIAYHGGTAIAHFVPFDDAGRKGNILPKFVMYPAGTDEGMAAAVRGLAEILMEPQWLTADAVREILAQEAQAVQAYLENPYSCTLEALYSGISPQDRFRGSTLGLIGNGTEAYLAYVEEMMAQPPGEVARMLRELAVSLADRQGLMVYMRGNRGALEEMLAEIVAAFPCAKQDRQLSVSPAAEGKHSMLVISPQGESAVHYMQVGVFENTGWKRTGQMDVMTRVLQNGYLLPELRNKRGAYGAQIIAENDYITMGASGVSSIDETYEVLMGAGDYLRGLDMTQAYLDAVIVAAVNAFDQSHGADAYYAMEADLNGVHVQWLEAHREEMLAATVEDVRDFAGFIDEMIRQRRIFAYTNEEGARTASRLFMAEPD